MVSNSNTGKQSSLNLPGLFVLTIVFLLGGYLSWRFFSPNSKPVENANVLLEKITAVAKLTTVEGQFSEIYDYSENQEGISSYFYGKKVLVRVKATVAAGYDLEAFHLESDPASKTIYMSALPEPQILSIDHTLDYYDITAGYFTSFKPADYNNYNQRAKEAIRSQALNSNLMTEARAQATKMIELMRFMVESAGWRLEVGHEGVRETQ
jgi:hypothetical protein